MAQFGEELAFLKTQALALQNIAVAYPNDYQPALEDVPRKVLPFQITILPPPTKRKASQQLVPSASSTEPSIALTIKSTKPSLTFQLLAHPTDTIQHIKSNLASQHPRAPKADDQRLLLKGKVLADNKLLKEYPISNSVNITLMSKPGSTWTGEERVETPVSTTGQGPPSPLVAEPETVVKPAPRNLAKPGASGHTRSMSGAADEMPVPSVVLSPTPDMSPKGNNKPMDVDLNMMNDPPRAMTPSAEGFYHVVKDPEFWSRLFEFLQGQFKTKDDAQRAWEDFFLASKTHLSAHEIAKIRDTTGLDSMAGV